MSIEGGAIIPVEEFWNVLKSKGIDFFSGVPCSILTGVVNFALKDTEVTYIPAPREDAALGIASGAYFCGKIGGILIQNSGLGNIINPLTSFNLIYHIPVLMVITWRGYQGKDAPEHLVMGEKTLSLLEEIGIPFEVLKKDNLEKSLENLLGMMEEKQIPGALILGKGIVE